MQQQSRHCAAAIETRTDGHTLQDQKIDRRPNEEGDYRVSQNAIFPFARCCQTLEFFNGDGFNIADAATVEIAGACMMLGMGVAPMFVWRKRQYTDELADDFIGAFRREE